MAAQRGGARRGAGRPRELPEWEREEVAHDFLHGMAAAAFAKWRKPYRAEIIRRLADEYSVSDRMVVRCINEFLPAVRSQNRTNKKGRV